MNGLKLYHLTFDGQDFYVEALSMHLAQAIWLDAMRETWGTEWTGEEEPDQIALVHDEPVLRGSSGEPEHGMGYGLLTEALIEEGEIDAPAD